MEPKRRRSRAPLLLPIFLAWIATLPAQSIYPIDRAEILIGSRFDFKVEFPFVVEEADLRVTINGIDCTKILGAAPMWIPKEKGGIPFEVSALVLRGARLSKPGPYVVQAIAPGWTNTVRWTAFQAAKAPVAKNVILLIADGLSIGHRTAARLLSRGMREGRYAGPLAMDTLDHFALVGTGSVDAITADSANTASAFLTGHKSSVNAMGVYADRTADPLDDPRQETLAEILRRTTKKSVGIVSDAEVVDATPASLVAHTRRRTAKEYIANALFEMKPEVLLGGGGAWFLPRSTPGSKRGDERMLVDEFRNAGYRLAGTVREMNTALSANPTWLLGLFHLDNMDGALDRHFLKNGTVAKNPEQPDLTEMFHAALTVLSKNPQGFFLMAEAGLVDKYSHPLDWERAAYDTIMFDQVVAMALEFQKRNPQTLIIVTGDHTHAVSVVGTVDDAKPGQSMRDKVGVMADGGFPGYTHSNESPYPDRVDPSRRLFVTIGNHPDYWETFRPKLDGPFVPALKDASGAYGANPAYAASPGAVLMTGNLPRNQAVGVHTVDDLVLAASGPGSERVRGFMENTEIFRIMAEALGLGR